MLTYDNLIKSLEFQTWKEKKYSKEECSEEFLVYNYIYDTSKKDYEELTSSKDVFNKLYDTRKQKGKEEIFKEEIKYNPSLLAKFLLASNGGKLYLQTKDEENFRKELRSFVIDAVKEGSNIYSAIKDLSWRRLEVENKEKKGNVNDLFIAQTYAEFIMREYSPYQKVFDEMEQIQQIKIDRESKGMKWDLSSDIYNKKNETKKYVQDMNIDLRILEHVGMARCDAIKAEARSLRFAPTYGQINLTNEEQAKWDASKSVIDFSREQQREQQKEKEI